MWRGLNHTTSALFKKKNEKEFDAGRTLVGQLARLPRVIIVNVLVFN
jgi:hypothetical protein